MKISTRKKIICLWCASVVSASISLTGITFLTVTDDPTALFRFFNTYRLIHKEYFRDISDTALLDGASKGMVASLEDPYSQLLTGDRFDDFMRQTSGEYGGVGVVIGEDKEGAFRVLAVFPGSAAETGGVQPGDQLMAVDGKSSAQMSLDDAAHAIRGDAGTKVSLSLLRNGNPVEITLERSNVSMPTVQANMVTGDIGYIHIYSFAKHTPEEFQREYEKLTQAGMKKMIIDLRMNPGGMIDSVVAVANQILSKGPVVSYQEKNGSVQQFVVDGTDHVRPMVILIDKNSASASEILAGAVQDKKEGTIIGETSYGKGTVQVVLPMADTEALKLSIAQYLTAAGRKIDKIGIRPDIPVEQKGYIFDLATDNVLEAAIEVLQKK